MTEPSSPLRTNLPAEPNAFVGRERDVADLRRLLEGMRAVTLCGAGGIGKTRLALHVARTMLDAHPDGVWLVELAGVRPDGTPEPVARRVAAVLDVAEEEGRRTADTLADALRGPSVLIVLDNCEHVIEECAELTGLLLARCPRMRVLATSREPLRMAGENVWRVPPLEPHEAVRLFADRARAARPGFDVTGGVEEVTRALDGMPLALELAAARVRVLSVEQIAGRLADRFRLLSAGDRTAPPRQRTLRAAIDWSHDLLGDRERTLLRRLSVFAGWTLEQAEHVCADGALPAEDVLDLLTALVDKSLVAVVGEMAGQIRFHQLDSIREYAAERLAEAGEDAEFRMRHRDTVLEAAEHDGRLALAEVPGAWADRVALFRRYDAELGNVQAALTWSLDRGDIAKGLRLCTALRTFWIVRGRVAEWADWTDRFLAHASGADPRTLGAALAGRAQLAVGGRDFAQAARYAEEALGPCRDADDPLATASALVTLAESLARAGRFDDAAARLDEADAIAAGPGREWVRAYARITRGYLLIRRGRLREAREHLDAGAAVMREIGQLWGAAHAIIGLGRLAEVRGDPGAARAHYADVLPILAEIGARPEMARALAGIGRVALDQRDTASARDALSRSLSLSRSSGIRLDIARALEAFAELAAVEGDARGAVTLAGAASALREATGRQPGAGARRERMLEPIRRRLGEPLVAQFWGEGRAMPPDDAVDYALHTRATNHPQTPTPRPTRDTKPPAAPQTRDDSSRPPHTPAAHATGAIQDQSPPTPENERPPAALPNQKPARKEPTASQRPAETENKQETPVRQKLDPSRPKKPTRQRPGAEPADAQVPAAATQEQSEAHTPEPARQASNGEPTEAPQVSASRFWGARKPGTTDTPQANRPEPGRQIPDGESANPTATPSGDAEKPSAAHTPDTGRPHSSPQVPGGEPPGSAASSFSGVGSPGRAHAPGSGRRDSDRRARGGEPAEPAEAAGPAAASSFSGVESPGKAHAPGSGRRDFDRRVQGAEPAEQVEAAGPAAASTFGGAEESGEADAPDADWPDSDRWVRGGGELAEAPGSVASSFGDVGSPGEAHAPGTGGQDFDRRVRGVEPVEPVEPVEAAGPAAASTFGGAEESGISGAPDADWPDSGREATGAAEAARPMAASTFGGAEKPSVADAPDADEQESGRRIRGGEPAQHPGAVVAASSFVDVGSSSEAHGRDAGLPESGQRVRGGAAAEVASSFGGVGEQGASASDGDWQEAGRRGLDDGLAEGPQGPAASPVGGERQPDAASARQAGGRESGGRGSEGAAAEAQRSADVVEGAATASRFGDSQESGVVGAREVGRQEGGRQGLGSKAAGVARGSAAASQFWGARKRGTDSAQEGGWRESGGRGSEGAAAEVAQGSAEAATAASFGGGRASGAVGWQEGGRQSMGGESAAVQETGFRGARGGDVGDGGWEGPGSGWEGAGSGRLPSSAVRGVEETTHLGRGGASGVAGAQGGGQWVPGGGLTGALGSSVEGVREGSGRELEGGGRARPSTPPSTLTVREREIARLVARGLTNRGIADELVISPATVARHVTNILTKLGYSSRAQIAAWVVETLPAED